MNRGEVAVDLRFGQLLPTGGSALRATRWAYRQGVAESRALRRRPNCRRETCNACGWQVGSPVKFSQGNVLRSSVTCATFQGRGSSPSTPPERAMRDGGGGG